MYISALFDHYTLAAKLNASPRSSHSTALTSAASTTEDAALRHLKQDRVMQQSYTFIEDFRSNTIHKSNVVIMT